jgi:hypothetical protein
LPLTAGLDHREQRGGVLFGFEAVQPFRDGTIRRSPALPCQDSRLLITTAAIAVSMLLLPFVGGSLPLALALMTVWGAGLGAIGIYNQSAILRAGRENKDAANGLTVLTIQLGITIGALYGSAALVVAGPLLVPAAAANCRCPNRHRQLSSASSTLSGPAVP